MKSAETSLMMQVVDPLDNPLAETSFFQCRVALEACRH